MQYSIVAGRRPFSVPAGAGPVEVPAPLSIMQKRLALSFVAAAVAVLSRSMLIEPPVNLV